MFEVGRLCIKIAGRDAGLKCVVVESLDENFVMIDGQTRRRKCNIKHLEPLKEVIKLKSKASHNNVVSEFKKLKIELKETKPKKATVRPKKLKKEKIKISEEEIKEAKKTKIEKKETSDTKVSNKPVSEKKSEKTSKKK